MVRTKAKTEADVEKLKQDWWNARGKLPDGKVWDLPNTKGFKKYYSELSDFEYSKSWELKYIDKANELKCSVELAKYIMSLENQLNDLINDISNIGRRGHYS